MSKKELRQRIYDFAHMSEGLSLKDKIKLVLFVSGKKPNTYIILKINPKNLGEKYKLDSLLKQNKIIFKASKPKSYEEIEKISRNKIKWKIKGLWYGYDLFKDKKSQRDFEKYRKSLSKNSALIAGRLYGYPLCCIKSYIKETPDYIKKNYTYYQYYKKLHDVDKKFPFISHTACSTKCKAVERLDKLYSRTVKKLAPKLWKEYTRKDTFPAELIVDAESDIVVGGKSIWPEKNGHDYGLILSKKHNKKHYIYTYLTKKSYERGTVLAGKVTQRHDYVNIKVEKARRKKIKGLHHERKFVLLGRKY
ncbi:hypothetical protein KY339_05785 [Candidatus Woesearchaeota archaeon]|nr:hypothetical protein [Candidatus Woesearchaeota archaeon]